MQIVPFHRNSNLINDVMRRTIDCMAVSLAVAVPSNLSPTKPTAKHFHLYIYSLQTAEDTSTHSLLLNKHINKSKSNKN